MNKIVGILISTNIAVAVSACGSSATEERAISYQVSAAASNCIPQISGLEKFTDLSELPASRLVDHFNRKPDEAYTVLHQSENKRYSPSTFFSRDLERLSVGWFSDKFEHVLEYDRMDEAAADYILFSFCKGRLGKR